MRDLNNVLQPSEACYDLIRTSEYNGVFPCRASWDENGWACGYGTHAPDVTSSTLWDRAESEARMEAYADVCGAAVKRFVTVPLTQGQFDALVDWAYEFGPHRLVGTTLLGYLNAGRYQAAADEFRLWVHVEAKPGVYVVSDGLVARRAREIALWNGGLEP